MLLWLTNYLENYFNLFHVFNYVTFRVVLCIVTSMLTTLILGPVIIRKLQKAQIGQVVRDDGPKSHLDKRGTPTMGGALILAAITITILLWGNPSSKYTWILLIVLLSFGLIGWVDDYKKLILKNSKGLAGRWKYFWQSAIGLSIALFLYFTASSPIETALIIPFLKNIIIPLGPIFILLTYFVIVGTSNAVNLTDGLDGLAILPVVVISGAFAIFAYVTGNIKFSEYLQLFYISGIEEVTIFCSAIVGAGLGFLWFNAYPAQIFMGDVGSLSLGGVLGTIAVLVRQELVLFIMGGVFVVETLSVILQVASFKLRKKRIFKMAPIHHHFELLGWPEPRVIIRFWIITIILVLIGLSTLKLR